jgi:hypothetical protein
MPRSKGRRTKEKRSPPLKIQPQRKMLIEIPKAVWGALLAFCTLLGAVVLWPRVNIEGTGDFSNPASIQFQITNTGYLPLRTPSVGFLSCDMIYGTDIAILKANPELPCDLSRITKSTPAYNNEWLEMDDTLTLRLEDIFRVEKLPILRASIVLTFFYYLPLIPERLHKRFGFKTAEGSDGKLYWRSYPVN